MRTCAHVSRRCAIEGRRDDEAEREREIERERERGREGEGEGERETDRESVCFAYIYIYIYIQKHVSFLYCGICKVALGGGDWECCLEGLAISCLHCNNAGSWARELSPFK